MKKVVITDSLAREEYVTIKELYVAYFEEMLSVDADAQLLSQAELKDVQESNIRFWAAKDPETNEIVGFAQGKTYTDGTGLLNHIFIKPEYRHESFQIGEEITSVLLALNTQVINWFLSEGMHTIELETTKSKLHHLGLQKNSDGVQLISERENIVLLRKCLEQTNGQSFSHQ